eukprot:13572468-Alexandrium_andersonii.AAC.1
MMRKAAAARGCKLPIGPTDPSCARPTGGVALLARKMARPAHVKPRTDGMAQYVEGGRCGIYVVDVAREWPVLVFNIYGWTEGGEKAEPRARTNAL